MPIRLFNTLGDRKEELVPLSPGKLGIYVCGPTVYDMSHVGHARVYVAFDTVVRYLRWSGWQVTYVRNYTDVDDKIIKRANERGEQAAALSERYIAEFRRDMEALACAPADVEPRVTGHIPEIVALVQKLVERGHAYAAGGDVYFSIRSFPAYAKLSRRNLDDLQAGARVEPGDQKRDPLDFALWKAAKPGEPAWESPWGQGRPGWHIECSAMSAKYLGETFDIHAGGKDLVFPHHENEIAQSEAASGRPFARYWLHNGFVTIDNEKMSKSLGNFFTIRDVLEKFDAQALRLFLLGTQYRGPINFSDTALRDAEKHADYLYETLAKAERRLGAALEPDAGPLLDEARAGAVLEGFREAMDDDFNTADAVGRLSDALAWLNELCDKAPAGAPKAVVRRTIAALRRDVLQVASVLRVGHESPAVYLDRSRRLQARRRGIDLARVEALLAERAEARKAKDFARADAIRAQAAELGVEIMDTPAGPAWRVV